MSRPRAKSRQLPNRVLYDDELASWSRRNVPGFSGVYSRTKTASVIRRLPAGGSIIINLDPNYAHGGTHWVALRVSAYAPIAYYKDSFGAPPPEDVVSAVHARGLGFIYGNRIRQKMSEDNCGKRAAEWLAAMSTAGPREIDYFESSETK